MKDMDKTVSMILAKIKPGKGLSVGFGPSAEEEDHDDLSMIAEELISAVKGGDTKGVVEALRGAFLCLDAEPHVEGKHIAETEEEGEEEEEEEETAGHEVGERLGGDKELFAKYFGGGKVKKYAEGGRVGPTSGVKGTAAMRAFKESPVLTEIVDTPGSRKADTEDDETVYKSSAPDYAEEAKKVAKSYGMDIGRVIDDKLLASVNDPHKYVEIRSNPAAYEEYKNRRAKLMQGNLTDSDISDFEDSLIDDGSDFWKAVEKRSSKGNAPSVKTPAAMPAYQAGPPKLSQVKGDKVIHLTDKPNKYNVKR